LNGEGPGKKGSLATDRNKEGKNLFWSDKRDEFSTIRIKDRWELSHLRVVKIPNLKPGGEGVL